MKLALVGATGLVGQKMIQVLEERNFPVTEFIPVASAKSVGKSLKYNGKEYRIHSLEEAVTAAPKIALFSAGGSVSQEWAPKFKAAGTTVVDNSSAWRMENGIPLVVPEVNASILTADDKIIANPNCSTIQMVLALNPLHQAYGIRRLVVSTYQSITGTGVKAVAQMEAERNGEKAEMAYPYAIDKNCLPQCDIFLDNGYTKEEMKLVHETRKILSAPQIGITATAVRIPTVGGHSESVNVEFEKDFDLAEVRNLLSNTSGVVVKDDPENLEYPYPLFAHDKDETFVGRLRRDESNPNTLNMWIVSDNLRKGAATNAVQIAEYLVEKGLV